MVYSVENQRCSVLDLFKLFKEFIGILPIGYYASANAVDFNRLKGLFTAGWADINGFFNIGYEATFRLFWPYGLIKTPDLWQATIHKYLFEAAGVTVLIPGSIQLKQSRKVFDDVIMLHNIWNALKLVFIDSVVNDEFELEDDLDVVDEEDEVLFEQ